MGNSITSLTDKDPLSVQGSDLMEPLFELMRHMVESGVIQPKEGQEMPDFDAIKVKYMEKLHQEEEMGFENSENEHVQMLGTSISELKPSQDYLTHLQNQDTSNVDITKLNQMLQSPSMQKHVAAYTNIIHAQRFEKFYESKINEENGMSDVEFRQRLQLFQNQRKTNETMQQEYNEALSQLFFNAFDSDSDSDNDIELLMPDAPPSIQTIWAAVWEHPLPDNELEPLELTTELKTYISTQFIS